MDGHRWRSGAVTESGVQADSLPPSASTGSLGRPRSPVRSESAYPGLCGPLPDADASSSSAPVQGSARRLDRPRTRRSQARSCCSWPVTSCQRCPSHRFAWPPSGPARLQWRSSLSDGCRVSNVAKHPGFPHGSRELGVMTASPGALRLKEGAEGSSRAGSLRGPNSASLPRERESDRTRCPPPRSSRRATLTPEQIDSSCSSRGLSTCWRVTATFRFRGQGCATFVRPACP